MKNLTPGQIGMSGGAQSRIAKYIVWVLREGERHGGKAATVANLLASAELLRLVAKEHDPDAYKVARRIQRAKHRERNT